MNLTIDIGNSNSKAALFDGRELVRAFDWPLGSTPDISVDKAIIVSTRGETEQLEQQLRARAKFVMRFDHTTPVPLKNLYATPGTLGADRLAAAAGAHTLFPGRTMLIVDFGTAITYDIVTAAGEYLGGNISPGAGSRLRALHDYTEALPLYGLPEETTAEFPARDTKSAIENGVATGIVAETEHYIARANRKFGETGVIFTGGDADYFARRVKFPIFAVSELVFQGLNAILEHNANL